MAKSARKGSSGSSGSTTVDKLAKAAMSKEMLAAGLAAAAAAISASPKARRAIRDAGLDAADTRIAGRNQHDVERDQARLDHCRSGRRRRAARHVRQMGR